MLPAGYKCICAFVLREQVDSFLLRLYKVPSGRFWDLVKDRKMTCGIREDSVVECDRGDNGAAVLYVKSSNLGAWVDY